MSSGRLIRILRSASFRLPLLYAVLFILSAGALFVTVYWTATAAMQSDMAKRNHPSRSITKVAVRP